MSETAHVTVMEPESESAPRAKPKGRAVAIPTPMAMLDRALSENAPLELISKLMDLQERWQATEAKKAFDEAIAAAKAEIPVIRKNSRVSFEAKKPGSKDTDYVHEDLGEIARTIDPILAKYGLSYRWDPQTPINAPISVTCILSHRMGHSVQVTLSAGRDESGGKNHLQMIGSAITYLERYSLKAALGLSSAEDDDAKASSAVGDAVPEFISEAQIAELTKLLKDTGGDVEKFCKFAKIATLSNIYADKYDAAVTAIKAAGEQRKAAKE